MRDCIRRVQVNRLAVRGLGLVDAAKRKVNLGSSYVIVFVQRIQRDGLLCKPEPIVKATQSGGDVP